MDIIGGAKERKLRRR